MKSRRSTIVIAAVLGVIGALGITANLTHVAVAGGTITTCDDAHLATALSGGGLVTFDCGTYTLTITSDHILAADTTIDGSNNGHPLTITASGVSFPFYVNAGKTLTLANVLIANVSGTNSGVVNAQGSLVISNSNFIGNNGGAVSANSGLTVTNSLFQANSGAYALTINTNGFGNVSNSQFVSNTNGAIYAKSSLTVNNSQFYSNSIGGAGVGAGIYAYAWSHPQLYLNIISSQFMTNTAHQAGGIAADGGVVVISNTQIVSNSTTYYPGGGLWYETLNSGDGMQIYNSTISDNQGGGISMNGGGGTVLVSNSWIENNHATVNTAGFDAGDMVLTITASYLINNHTTSNSPGGLNDGGPADITGTLFLNNSGGHGGGAYLSNGGSPVFTDTIANSYFLSNTSLTYEGGGVNAAVPLIVADSVFSQNVTPLDGGGLYWWPNTIGGLSVARSLFYANQAQNSGTGGGIYVHGNANIVNSTLYANTAANAGGIQLSNSSSLTLTNDTIVSNTATNPVNYGNLNGGSALTPMTLVNTIVADGSPKSCGGVVTSFGYNLSSDSACFTATTGDFSNTNPLLGSFANNGGPSWTLVPTANSPAVNGGNNAYCPSTDQRGVARPIGPACDIGAVESPYVLTPQVITFNPLPDKLISDPPFAITATASSGLPVAFNSGGVCSVSGITVTLSGIVGSCTITATQAGNGVYAPALPVVNRFNVSGSALLTQTITFNSLPDRKISASPFVVTATASSGLVVTFTTSTILNCTATGTNGSTITLIHVGTCTVVAHQAGNATYAAAADVPRSFQITNSVIFLPVVLKDF